MEGLHLSSSPSASSPCTFQGELGQAIQSLSKHLKKLVLAGLEGWLSQQLKYGRQCDVCTSLPLLLAPCFLLTQAQGSCPSSYTLWSPIRKSYSQDRLVKNHAGTSQWVTNQVFRKTPSTTVFLGRECHLFPPWYPRVWEELKLLFKVLLGAEEICLTLSQAACPVLLSLPEQLELNIKKQLRIVNIFLQKFYFASRWLLHGDQLRCVVSTSLPPLQPPYHQEPGAAMAKMCLCDRNHKNFLWESCLPWK